MFDDLREATSLGKAGQEIGHTLGVEHVGKRFKITCTCGFSTPTNVRMRTAFIAGTEHVKEQIRLDKQRQNPPPRVESRFIS